MHSVLSVVALAAAVASTSPAPATDARSASMDISEQDVQRLETAMFKRVDKVGKLGKSAVPHIIPKPASEMPSDQPIVHVAACDANGIPVIWTKSGAINEPLNSPAVSRASIEGYLICTAASGDAGPRWKARYDALSDKTLLAKQFFEALNRFSHAQEEKTSATIALLHSDLTIGMPRTQVYAVLKNHGLIAFNDDYNPGKPFKLSLRYNGKLTTSRGCSYSDTKALSYWPRFGQPIPKRDPACGPMPQPSYVPSPDAYLELPAGYDVGCGSTIDVTLKFDLQDRLSSVSEAPKRTICV